MEEKQDVFFSKCMLGTDDQEDENCQRSGNFHFVSVCFCPVETGCSSVVPQPKMMVNCKWLSPSFLLLTFLPCSTLCFAPWLMFDPHLSAAFRSPATASILALSSHFFCWKTDKETKPTVERKWNQAIPLGLLLRAIDLSPSPFLSRCPNDWYGMTSTWKHAVVLVLRICHIGGHLEGEQCGIKDRG